MNLHADDPRLSAYLLGELSATESDRVARAIAADPALGLALRELDATRRWLADSLAGPAAELLPQQRHAVLRAARSADSAAPENGAAVFSPGRPASRRKLLFSAAAAALITFGAFLLLRAGSGLETIAKSAAADKNPFGDRIPAEIALLPATAPPSPGHAAHPAGVGSAADLSERVRTRDQSLATSGQGFLQRVAAQLAAHPPPAADALPGLVSRPFVAAASHPRHELPVFSGAASLGWVAHSVRSEGRLPSANTVRLEEMLNHFPLRPQGPSATEKGVTLSTECFSCPWRPSSTLLMVHFHGSPDATREVKASLSLNPSFVDRYRLLGYAMPGAPGTTLPSRMPAKAANTLILELEIETPNHSAATVEWSVDDSAADALGIGAAPPDAPPSADARFAALVCAYAQWLSRDPAGAVDSAIVSALARQNDSQSLPADRQDFLKLVRETLALAERAGH